MEERINNGLEQGGAGEDEVIKPQQLFRVYKSNKRKYDNIILIAALIVCIIGLLVGVHNWGYSKGYKHVQEYYEERLAKFCFCFDEEVDPLKKQVPNINLETNSQGVEE